ncbi:MAG: site-2 protease family protein, partial [Dongiaceae bacterium]
LLFGGGIMVLSPTLGKVRADGPAAIAGLQRGDRITAVAGRSVADFDGILDVAADGIDQEVEIALLRDGASLGAVLRPIAPRQGSEALADIGATSAGRERIYPGPLAALDGSMVITVDFLKANFRGIAEIVSGERSIDDLAGPVRIAEFSGDTMLRYGLLGLIWLTALLSINIGVVNLLPIPVLDGGHLLFMAFETVRRQPLSPRILKICSLGGLSVILVVFLLITSHDLARLDLFG